jgi:hypothetical protein
MFCDLVGYTQLSSATVDRFGGKIDKHIGDAAMALFGAPLARGNDAERAVRAALEIQASAPKLASGLHSPLAVHIGVATGEVIASSVGSQHHRGYTVTGEAANIAARLLEKATSGETLVSDAVYEATNHVGSYTFLGLLALKGIGHPVEAWRLTGMKSSAPDAHALVGRRLELGQFRAALDACVNGTFGTALLIRGEAGIGKTRLMDELQSIAAASGMSCTAGFALDFGTARGHGAVRTVVAGLLGLGSEATPDVAERAINALVRDGSLQVDDALYARDLLEMSQPEATRKIYEAMDTPARTHGKERVVAALVKSSADNRPLLVAIEDVHWADRETLSLLAAVTRATGMSRTVLAMTSRLEGDPLDAHWRSMAVGGTLVTVDLAPLSPADARSIAARFIDVTAFADQCVERAGGIRFSWSNCSAARETRPTDVSRLPFRAWCWRVRTFYLPKTAALSRRPRSSANASALPISERYSGSRSTIVTFWCEMSWYAQRGMASSSLMRWYATVCTARSRMQGSASCTLPQPRFLPMIRCCGPSTWTVPASPKRRVPISQRQKHRRSCSARTKP